MTPFSLTSILSMLGYGLSSLYVRLLESSVKTDLNWVFSISALLVLSFFRKPPGFSVLILPLALDIRPTFLRVEVEVFTDYVFEVIFARLFDVVLHFGL